MIPVFTSEFPVFAVAVDLVVLTLRSGRLHVLLVERGEEPYLGRWALPGGFVRADESLTDAAHRELAEEAGLTSDDVVLEQLRSYGGVTRDPRPERVVSVAWMVLGADLPDPRPGGDAADARWCPVDEASGIDLAFDHAAILADGVERARAKLEYTTLATAFCPSEFSVPQLRTVYEAVWGEPLDPRNFARKVLAASGFLVDAGRTTSGRGRPARLYRAGLASELDPPLRRG